MTFLADENVDRAVVHRLRSDGHDVDYVAEMRAGITDEQVLALAERRGTVLITPDRTRIRALRRP